MPHITREDGTHFVIPSYRDVLSAKKPALLKKEILLLSSNYGNYITLQRKNVNQYEAAFASEVGYLLGESVWLHFKQPSDMIYCEAIPDTTEAILVIVRYGSVYLDGRFPLDSIPDELVVFKTQTGYFDIYVHGNVPISEAPEEGKFSLDKHSVKTFTVLPEALFPTLRPPREYLLGPAEDVLRQQGIGVIPIKKIVMGLTVPVIIVLIVFYYSSHQEQAPQIFVETINPWQSYYNTLNAAPAATAEINSMLDGIARLYDSPGWAPEKISYSNGKLTAMMRSPNMETSPLFAWANQNNAGFDISGDGILITLNIPLHPREPVNFCSPLKEILITIIDSVRTLSVGMAVSLGDITSNGPYSSMPVGIIFKSASLKNLGLLASKLNHLPIILVKSDITVEKIDGSFNGTLTLQALGN